MEEPTFWRHDIMLWYRHFNGVCDTCGADMKLFHPAQNIANHFTGECKNQGWVTSGSDHSRSEGKDQGHPIAQQQRET